MQHLITPDTHPTLPDQLVIHLAVPVHGHEPVRVYHLNVARQRLTASPHPTGGTGFHLPVRSGGEKPAIQRGPQGPADRLDPEPCAMSVDIRDHQRRVGSSLAAKKADAEERISLLRRNSAFSRRSRFNSADSLGPAEPLASARSCQRRSDSVATPRFLATPCNAFVSDE
jgi:hypothetical protein